MIARLCENQGLHQKILKLTGKISLPVEEPWSLLCGAITGQTLQGKPPGGQQGLLRGSTCFIETKSANVNLMS